MAINDLKTDLTNLLSSNKAYNIARKAVGAEIVHEGRLYINTVGSASMEALKRGLKIGFGDSKKAQQLINANATEFSDAFMNKKVLEVLNTFNGGEILGKYKGGKFGRGVGAYNIDAKQWGFICIPAKGGIYFNFVREFNRAIFQAWKDDKNVIDGKLADNVKNLKNAEPYVEGFPDQSFDPVTQTSGVRTTHMDSSVYEGYVLLKAEELQAALNIDIDEINIPKALIEGLRGELKEDIKAKKNTLTNKRTIQLTLNKRDFPIPLDLAPLKKSMAPGFEKLLAEMKYINPKTAADAKGSETFKSKAQRMAKNRMETSIVKELRSVKKAKLKVKGTKTKKVKSEKRQAILKKGTKSKAKAKKLSIAQRVSVAKFVQGKRKEKGSKEKGSSDSLIKIRSYIQKRLPAEVRRNMGRPQLINRTGRFSNSVNLLKLTQGQNTVVAKYTYMMNPYETFENTGQRKWPLAYNPKPLIAKSIRNLAIGRIEQKITVRRM